MATVKFGTFSKRRNSTKQPTTELSDSRTVMLKEATSQDNPVFICTGNDFNYNYCEWDSKYYFINEIISLHNNEIEIHCILDALATYKTNILALTAYVMYDSTSNTEIPDNRIPIKTTASVQSSAAACPLVPDSGTYILSLTGSNNTTGIYKVTASQLASLIDDVAYINNNLFDYPSPPQWETYNTNTDISSVGANIAAAAENLRMNFEYIRDCLKYTVSQFFGSGNCSENIRQCLFIPFDRGTTYGANDIYLGTFKTQQQLPKLATDTIYDSATVSIPWQASDYRRRSPYTDVYLYIPYIGMVKLSSENLIGQSSVTVGYALSLRDGSLIATVSSGSQIIGQYSGNVGVSVPVGISNINLPKAAQSVLTGVVAAASKSWGALGMSAINLADSVTPNFSCIGGLDGLASIATNQNITCYTVFHDTVAAPNTALQDIGSPTMSPKALSALTGYCQCVDAHVEAPATAEELDAIDNFLNSGFFIE